MFKFAEKRQVWWPVKIEVPADGGTTYTKEIDVLFELFTKSEARAAVESGTTAEAVIAKVRDWRKMDPGADDAPLPCTPDIVRALFEHYYIESAFISALMAASRGEAVAKNS